MRSNRWTVLTLVLTALPLSGTGGLVSQHSHASPAVTTRRVPNGGIQPEIVRDAAGAWHLLYFSGNSLAGDLFYVVSKDEGATFTAPIRVNGEPGSAIARGAIRGGQLAVGRNGRVHVTWNGSEKSSPQFYYARLNDGGRAFERQRGLMQRSTTLDGGGAIAADAAGNVYAVWHGNDARAGDDGEGNRRVWIARSSDDGRTFSAEAAAWKEPTGACGCCGMRMLVRGPAVHLLYRSATASINRDIYLLTSSDGGQTFAGSRVHEWDINACPMTSMSLVPTAAGVVGAWETKGQVYFGMMGSKVAPGMPSERVPDGLTRKHPRLAADADGDLLLVWTEATSMGKVGTLAWQEFGRASLLGRDAGSVAAGAPALSFGAPVPRRGGGFTIFH